MCDACKIRPLTIGSLVCWSGAQTLMQQTCLKKRVHSVWNDSRKVGKGDVFVALKTDNDDGHKYVEAAFQAGAAAAIVAGTGVAGIPERYRAKLIVTRDPLKALQRAATRYRKELGILLVGITGSNGKTTTRSFISSVLRQQLPISETFGNWNNHIGVPMSILRFTGEEWAGVIEMGANHLHEIHELSKIAQPDIAVITNIGYGHIGLFGSLNNTASAKFEIADGLNRRDGFMLLNGDDPRLVEGARRRGLPTVFFGYSRRCTVRPENVKLDVRNGISFTVDGYPFRLSMPGRHFIYSALPAIFLGRRCGISDKLIAEALAALKPVEMRGAVVCRKKVSFIVDCYNANPSSMKSAIAFLVDTAPPSRRAAIVGDMLELGKHSARLHRELGRQIAEAGIRKVIAVGAFAPMVEKGARDAGVAKHSIVTVENDVAALAVAREKIREGDMVLLKGSRGNHLETVYKGF